MSASKAEPPHILILHHKSNAKFFFVKSEYKKGIHIDSLLWLRGKGDSLNKRSRKIEQYYLLLWIGELHMKGHISAATVKDEPKGLMLKSVYPPFHCNRTMHWIEQKK